MVIRSFLPYIAQRCGQSTSAVNFAARARSNWEYLQAKLAEIDENIERTPLTVLEYSVQLNDRKNIYEGLHPETKQHVAGAAVSNRTRHGKPATSDKMSFAADTAQKLKKTMRSVQRDLAIAKGIDHAVQKVISGTPIANKKSELLKLAKMPIEQQKKVAARV
jgi:ParB family chromosome partitioning protein